MNKNDARFKYVGNNPFLKELFADESFYIMDYHIGGERPITNDELHERFEPGPAHVDPNGRVMRFLGCIGHIGREFLIDGAKLDD